MAWVKVDDGFADHRKFVDLSLADLGLWAAGLAYANRQRTDGRIPTGWVRRMSGTRQAKALVAAGLGDNGEQVRALLAAGGFDGLVVEATGGGHVSLGMAESLEEAARAMPVILASRIGVGDTLTGTYGFPGSEIDLQRRGLLVSGCLDGRKARVLLTLVLRHCPGGRDAVADAFAPWSGESSCAS